MSNAFRIQANHPDEPLCCCYEREGDNKDCPIHGDVSTEDDKSGGEK